MNEPLDRLTPPHLQYPVPAWSPPTVPESFTSGPLLNTPLDPSQELLPESIRFDRWDATAEGFGSPRSHSDSEHDRLYDSPARAPLFVDDLHAQAQLHPSSPTETWSPRYDRSAWEADDYYAASDITLEPDWEGLPDKADEARFLASLSSTR